MLMKYKKDITRDYSTAAFIFYARCGGAKKYIETIVADLQKQRGSGVCKPTEAAIINKEKIIEEKHAELADLEAVYRTIARLEMTERGRDVLEAVDMVYCRNCWREWERGDMERRVHYAEIHIPASRVTIYRWLREARHIFAEERGLRQ
jgi:hypothetical protein